MPKVLRIINRFNLGGPTYNVAYLTKYLSPEFETLLVGGAKDDTEDSSEHILEKLGIKPIIIPEMKREIDLKNDYIAYKKIKKIIREFKPDIVHTHAAKAGTLGRLAAYSENVPIILHTFHGHVFHSYFGKLKTIFYKNIERYLARKSDCIIAISGKQKQELSEIHKICKPEKIKVVPLGFDLKKFEEGQEEKRNRFRRYYNIADNELAITIVGRLVPVKNHKLFLEAINYVRQRTSKKIKAFIVGDGEERKNIEKMAGDLNLDFSSEHNNKAILTFTSWIKDVDYVCAGSDIISLASLNEGTPVSLIEAQAANKPIVSTKTGGIENIVIEGKTALLSDLDSPEDFYKNLLEVVENDKFRRSMSTVGNLFVKEKFHYTRLCKDMKELYNVLLKKQI